MKHSLSGSFSYIYSLCSVLLSSSALDIRPWYASIFSSLLEGDPRKSGVVVIAAKLTSSASPYPFSFIIHRFIQHAYVPIHHSTPIPVYLHHSQTPTHLIPRGDVSRWCRKLVFEFVERRADLVVSWEYYGMRVVILCWRDGGQWWMFLVYLCYKSRLWSCGILPKNCRVAPSPLRPRRKMSRYFGDILCVEWYRHDISWRNISPTIFRDKSREIGDLSRYIGDFGEKSTIFPRYIAWSTRVNGVNALQWKSNVLQCPPATVHLPFCLKLLPRGFEPQTKRFRVQSSCHLG